MWSVRRARCCRCPASLVDPARPGGRAALRRSRCDDARVAGLRGPRRAPGGVSAQAFCVDVSAHPKTRTSHGLIVLLNAEIVEASRNEKGREGCMSVPDLTGDVKRATKITVAGLFPLSGERVLITTDAFEARALQHEIDHCKGMLFLDRVIGAHALYARKVYLEPATGTEDLEPAPTAAGSTRRSDL